MKTIYLVMAGDQLDPVRGFVTQPSAKAFAEKCRAHTERRPPPPEVIEDTPENDALHNAWWDKLKRWQKRHPAGVAHANADSYSVMPLKLEGLS